MGRRIRIGGRLFVNPHVNQPKEMTPPPSPTPLGETTDKKIWKKEDRLELMFCLQGSINTIQNRFCQIN